jgi:hypothetical protein
VDDIKAYNCYNEGIRLLPVHSKPADEGPVFYPILLTKERKEVDKEKHAY